jgi:hypothetical protein
MQAVRQSAVALIVAVCRTIPWNLVRGRIGCTFFGHVGSANALAVAVRFGKRTSVVHAV